MHDDRHHLAGVIAERTPPLCETCGRLVDTDHRLVIVGPVEQFTASWAEKNVRELERLKERRGWYGDLEDTFVAERICVLEARLAHWNALEAVPA